MHPPAAKAPRPTRWIHVAAIALALWMFGWVALPGGPSALMVVVAACHAFPLAVWWPWALGAARAGHLLRGPVVGVLLAIPVALLYPQLYGIASSDAQGGLVYVFLPFYLLVATAIAVGLAEVVGRMAALLDETGPPQPARRRSSQSRDP